MSLCKHTQSQTLPPIIVTAAVGDCASLSLCHCVSARSDSVTQTPTVPHHGDCDTVSLCTVPFCQTHTVTWTHHPLLPACLCGWVAAHSHSRTGALRCLTVDTACERVRDYNYVIVSKHTVSVTLVAVWLRGCDCAHVARSRSVSQSVSHANSVTQCVTQSESMWRSV